MARNKKIHGVQRRSSVCTLLFLALLGQTIGFVPAAYSAPGVPIPQAPTAVHSSINSGSVGNAIVPSSLNLGSTSPITAAPNTAPIVIRTSSAGSGSPVPGVMTVQPGQTLTAAQYVAVSQVLASGLQGLILNRQGAAVGGLATITPGAISKSLSTLAIPQNVTLDALGFGTQTPFVVNGNANIAGALYALQSVAGLASALQFDSLTVAKTGLVSGSVPSGNAGSGAFSSKELIINVTHALNNAGVIANDQGALTINSQSGVVTNSGSIQARNALTIQSPSALQINGAGGTFQSTRGAILLSTALATNPANLFVQGGDWKALLGGISVTAPHADISIYATSLNGPVSLAACNAIVGAAKGDVSIVKSDLSEDPLFFAQAGNLDLSNIGFGSTAVQYPDGTQYLAFKTSGADFVALASGNITCTGCVSTNNYMIDAASSSPSPTSGTGGNITIDAGVNFSVTGAGTPIACTTCGSAYNLLGPSSTGGNVNIPLIGLRTNGGAVNVQANSGTTNAGNISLLNAETSGVGGVGGTATSQPNGGAGAAAGNITIEANGPASTITVGSNTGTGLDNGFLRAYGGGGGGAARITGTNAIGGNGGAGGNVLVNAAGAISIYGDVNTSGGAAGASSTALAVLPSGGNAGAIAIVSGSGAVTLGGPVLAGGGGGGGNSATSQAAGGGSFAGGGGGSGSTEGAAGGGIGGGGQGAITSVGSARGGSGFFGGGGTYLGGASAAPGAGILGQGAFPGIASNFGQATGTSNDGGAVGQPGSSGSLAGNGGSIVLSGTTVGVNSKIGNYYNSGPFNSTSFSGVSIMTTGTGTITISEPVYSTYAANSDLTVTTNPTAASPVSSTIFTVNSSSLPVNGSGTWGTINSVVAANINGVSGNGSPNQQIDMSTGTFNITESGTPVPVTNTSTGLTAAEVIAAVQTIVYGSSALTLTGTGIGTGVATGGTFSIAPSNNPSGGLQTLVIPDTVIATVTGPGLNVASGLTVNGTGSLAFASALPGAGWLSTPSLTIFGSGSTVASNVVFGSNYKIPTEGAGTYAGVIISPTGSGLTITTLANTNPGGITSAGIRGGIVNGGSVLFQSSSGNQVAFQELAVGTSQLTISSAGSGTPSVVSDNAILVGLGVTLTSVGSLNLVTPALSNVGTISAVGANQELSLTSPGGINLTLNGGGTIAAGSTSSSNPPTDGSVEIYSANGNVRFTGTNTALQAGMLNITSFAGNVTLDPGSTITADGALFVTGNFVGSLGGLVNHSGPTPVVTPVSSASNFGTIANPNGDITLTSNVLINTGGKNLVLLASGNITSSGVSSIDLSSSTGQGGSLTALAGFNFAQSASATPDTSTVFLVTGPSTSGGSINLSNVSINTSSFAPGSAAHNDAGSVTMAATAGTSSSGTIYTGGIQAISLNGNGGTVKLYGAGGVNVNGFINTSALNTSSARAAGNIGIMTGPVAAVAFPVLNGTSGPSNPFLVNIPNPLLSPGAAVQVSGPITTSSSSGAGGNLFVTAESLLQLTQSITTSGSSTSGAVTLVSSNGAVNLGSITTAGSSIFSSVTGGNGGTGGAVIITAPASIAITGNVLTNGGSTVGIGAGGSGGAVVIQTTHNEGQISIVGGINASGGSARTSSGGGVGGNSGAVAIMTGAMQIAGIVVNGSSFGSVIASGGQAFAGNGTNGSINLTTYATQSIPSNFNLTSSSASEYALPGGLFTIGAFPLINGTAGSIISGAFSISSTTPGSGTATPGAVTAGNSLTQGSIAITSNVSGTSTLFGSATPITAGTSNAGRNKVTPAQAVALFELTQGNLQTVGLDAQGRATSSNPQGGLSNLPIPEYDLPAFTSFVIATQGVVTNGITINISGNSPVLNLSNAINQNISAFINFGTANTTPLINAGFQNLTVKSGAGISSVGSLIFEGQGAFANNGNMTAATEIFFVNPSGVVNLTNTSTGVLVGADIRIPSNAMPAALLFSNASGAPALPLSINAAYFPTQFGTAAQTLTAGSSVITAPTLQLTAGGANGPVQITGTLGSNLQSLTIITLADASNNKTALNLSGDVSRSSFVNVLSNGDLTINGPLTVGPLTILSTYGLNSNIAINGNILGSTSTSAITITANGSGNITQLAGTSIVGNSLSLNTTSGNIGTAAANIQTAVKSLSVNIPTFASNATFITQTGDLATGVSSTIGGSLTLTVYGNLTIASGATIVGRGINLVTSGNVAENGFLEVIGSVLSSTGSTTAGSNVLTGVTNASFLSVGSLIAGTGIPAGATITGISGSNVTISQNATSTNASTSLIGGILSLLSQGNFTQSSSSTLVNVYSPVTLTNSSTTINGVFGALVPSNANVTVNANNNITSSSGIIQAAGTMYLSSASGAILMSSPSSLLDTSGNISVYGPGAVTLSTVTASLGNLDVSANNGNGGGPTTNGTIITGGSVNIANNGGNSTPVIVNQPIFAGGAVTLSNNQNAITVNSIIQKTGASAGDVHIEVFGSGSVTVGSVINTNGNILLKLNGNGTVAVNSGSTLLALGASASTGNVTLNNTGTNGKVAIGSNVTIEAISSVAGGGNVSMFIKSTATQQAGTAPSNVNPITVGTGQIFYGSNFSPSFTANGPTNTIVAKNANVLFFINSTNSSGSAAITLGGGDFILADPPSAGVINVAAPISVGAGAVPVAFSSAVPPAFSTAMAPVSLTNPTTNSGLKSDVSTLAVERGFGTQNVFNQFLLNRQNSEAVSVTAPAEKTEALTGGVSKNSRGLHSTTPYQLHTSENCQVGRLGSNGLELTSGELLISSNGTTLIKSGEYRIETGSGSLVMVTREGPVSKVRNLFDQPGHAVRVLVDGQSLKIRVGEELVLGTDQSSVSTAMSAERIGRRDVSFFVVDGKHTVAQSEIALTSLIRNNKLLSSIYFSSNKCDRTIADKIMKAAACLYQVTASRGAYKVQEPIR